MADLATAYLRLIPSLKGAQRTIESELSGINTKPTGESLGAGLGGGITAGLGKIAIGNFLGNILTQGVDMAVSAATDTFKNAFENFGTFEQLSGGVEKIFDEANIDQIMTDAQNAYKDLNMSANQYLDTINQVGATFAQTMGDQKGYDTARLGMKAIADFASGTGKSVDLLTEKYGMITRATSSYQSIADQFNGILPGTNAEFLAQAQAEGYLSDEYTKLTEVPMAEYQEAVSKMLEKGVADMGLAGNTAKESTETISGSLAMLRASWSNFLTELGKENADIPARTQELVESIVATVKNIAPMLLDFARNLFAAIPELVNELQPYIDEFIAMASAFIEEHQPEIEAAANMLFDGIKAALSKAIEAAILALGDFLVEFSFKFTEWGPALLQIAAEVFMSIVQGLVLGIKPFMNQLESMMNDGISAIGSFFSDFLNSGAELVMSIASGIGGAIDYVARAIGDVVNAITSPISDAVSTVGNLVDEIIGFFSGLGDRITSAIGSIHFPSPSIWFEEIEIGPARIPVPHVDWYATGGFVDGASLIGVGERGGELIWPSYGPYLDKYAQAIASHIPGRGGVDIHDCTFNVRKDSDIRAVAVELNTLINRQTAGGLA